MATTVNNTTVNSRITIIFDADGNLDGNGPAKGTGNTESDVYLVTCCTKHIDVLYTFYLEEDTSRQGRILALIFCSNNHISKFNIHSRY